MIVTELPPTNLDSLLVGLPLAASSAAASAAQIRNPRAAVACWSRLSGAHTGGLGCCHVESTRLNLLVGAGMEHEHPNQPDTVAAVKNFGNRLQPCASFQPILVREWRILATNMKPLPGCARSFLEQHARVGILKWWEPEMLSRD